MAFLGREVSVDQLPKGEAFAPIPAGEYQAYTKAADLRATKAGTGSLIHMKFDITGPTHQGRVVFCNINFSNPSVKAEEIGQQQLRRYMEACGITRFSDTDELVGKFLRIKVTIKQDAGREPENEVKDFLPTAQQPAVGKGAAPAAPRPVAAPTAPPAAKAAPWATRATPAAAPEPETAVLDDEIPF